MNSKFTSVSVLTIKSGLSVFFFLLFSGLVANNALEAQVSNVENPSGGFEIDGNLEANSPTSGVGDWVMGSAGSGGFVFDQSGNPLTSLTQLFRDEYGHE